MDLVGGRAAELDGGALALIFIVAAAKLADNGNHSFIRSLPSSQCIKLIVYVLDSLQSHEANHATEPMSQRHVWHAALSTKTASNAGRTF